MSILKAAFCQRLSTVVNRFQVFTDFPFELSHKAYDVSLILVCVINYFLDFVERVDNGGVITIAENRSDLLKTEFEFFADQINADAAGKCNCFRARSTNQVVSGHVE